MGVRRDFSNIVVYHCLCVFVEGLACSMVLHGIICDCYVKHRLLNKTQCFFDKQIISSLGIETAWNMTKTICEQLKAGARLRQECPDIASFCRCIALITKSELHVRLVVSVS